MSNSLITLAQYKAFTNNSDSTYDTLINTYLIPVVSEAIESYCDRVFNSTQYYEWFSELTEYTTEQYPIQKVQGVGYGDTALTIVNSSTTNKYFFSIIDQTLQITDKDLTTNTYDLTDAANDTLTELDTVLSAAYADFTITVDTDVIQKSYTLKPAQYTLLNSSTIEINGIVLSNIESEIYSDNIVRFTSLDNGYGCSSVNNVLIYYAGYTTIPTDLQYVTSLIVRDYLDIVNKQLNSNIKSESITNYSYTLADGLDLKAIVESYNGMLNKYKRIVI